MKTPEEIKEQIRVLLGLLDVEDRKWFVWDIENSLRDQEPVSKHFRDNGKHPLKTYYIS